MISKTLPALFAGLLMGTAAAQSSVNLVWNKNPENNVNKYNVLVGTSSGNLSVVQSVTSPAATLSGLSPSTTYYCAVQAVNTDNLTSPRSSVISFTTNSSTATAPEIAVERLGGNLTDGSSSVNFGSVQTGSSTGNQTFTIRNLGNANLTGLSLSKSGGQASDFINSGLSRSTLAPGASTTFTVRFAPGRTGPRSTTLHIASNDANESPFNIGLSGTGTSNPPPPGTAPEIEVIMTRSTPLLLTSGKSTGFFGKVRLRAEEKKRYFTIRNTGNAALSGLEIASLGKHASHFIPGTLEKTSLAPNESVDFWVAFKPKWKGKKEAMLRIMSNDADEGSFEIDLIGKGLPAPKIAIQTASGKSFDKQKPIIDQGKSSIGKWNKPTKITITNNGNSTLKNLSLVKSGIHKKDFPVGKLKVESLAPGESTTLKIGFQPRSKGARRAFLSVLSNDPAKSTFRIKLLGKGKGRKGTAPAASLASSLTGGSAATKAPAPVQSYSWIDGEKFRCITIARSSGGTITSNDAQVSCNLVDWFSGRNHTTVIEDNASLLKVRDNTPLSPGTKRYIRIRPGR